MIVQSLPEVVRPHVVALYRYGKLESILVGRLESKLLSFRVGYVNLFRPWARCLTFVYGAIHGDASAQSTEVLVHAVMDSLNQGEADVALFEFAPLDTPLYQLALRLPGVLRRDTRPAPQAHHSLALPSSIDGVYSRMSRERRKHTKASIKKLEAGPFGKVTIACYSAPQELDKLFQDAEEIARKTYQRGLGVGFADNPMVRRRLELGARKGWLRAFMLYVGDRPCAFWIGMLYQGTFVSEYMGYDPEFRQHSPGMVLIMRVIEGFCRGANGDVVRELDFGLGHAEYKEALCSRTWQEAAVFIFSPTLKGITLKLMRTVTRLLDGAARRALAATDMVQRLKRVWRDRRAKRQWRPSVSTEPASQTGPPVGSSRRG
jgi:hypothetical protein